MTDTATATNPLIAPKPDTSTWHTGINLLDDASSLQESIASGSWVGTGLSALGTGLDTVAMVTNPIATLVSYGFNYLIEHIKPLQDSLNWLAGDAAQISGYAATWHNVATSVGQSGQTFTTSLTTDTAGWTGTAATNYRAAASDTVNTIQASSTAADTLGSVTALIGGLVSAARTLIRDLVSQATGQFVQLGLIALTGVGTIWAARQATVAVVAWMRRIADVVRNVTGSLTKLQPLMQRLAQLWTDIKQAFTARTPKPAAPTPPAAPAPTTAAASTAKTTAWPKRSDYDNPTDFGRDKHNALAEILRPFEGTKLKNGWEVSKVERTVGGTKRVDVMYVNHAEKRILVEDYVTGQTESVAHASKGWNYMNEPEIQNLVNQGYKYDYVPSYTEKLQ